MTSKKYRPWNPDQAYLFPPSMRDWLEEDHLVYRLLDAVGSLDIRPISHSIHAKDARGARPYNPRMMLALLLYSYMNGIYSSRQIAAATYERIDFRAAQRNFTDPDSRIMKRGGSYLQGYNCQAVVDEENQLIVAEGVTNQAPDQEHLVPMMERVKNNSGRTPTVLTADTGYMSSDNSTYCEGEGIDAYIAVGRDKHGQEPGAKERSGGDECETWATMRAKLATEQGKKLYSRRKVIVEPVFGHIKEPRGFRRFSLRGVFKVRAEWTLVCLCHNLIKLLAAQPALASA